MKDLKATIDAAIATEYAAMNARHELALAFCTLEQPEDVAEQIKAREAAMQRITRLERSRAYWLANRK